MVNLRKFIDFNQISTLLWKDFLIRCRQPWMTFLQYLWPSLIFVSLYILRNRFNAVEITDCQFPTRQLPAQNGILPFFQSYICTIENKCLDPNEYQETINLTAAPLTPILNIVQIVLNSNNLFNAIVKLPDNKNLIGTITTLGTDPDFANIQDEVKLLTANLPKYEKLIGSNFRFDQLFSDDRVFSESGNIFCAKPFPRSDNIRFIENVFYTKDYNGPDKDELKAMPTDFCKQLYLDVTNSNQGKITWNLLKPIIQGKILYGPITDKTHDIVKYANATFITVGRLRDLFGSLSDSMQLLRDDDTMKKNFNEVVNLAKSPFIKTILASMDINADDILNFLNMLKTDENIFNAIKTAVNILGCFSVDRFVPVANEKELEDLAIELHKNKTFMAAVYFTSIDEKRFTYKIRMDIDNTPITLENRNRFWFPGPLGSFELDHRYHRGFIQIQHSVDQAIIRSEAKIKLDILKKLEAEKEKIASTTIAEIEKSTLKDDDDFDDTDTDDNSTDSVPTINPLLLEKLVNASGISIDQVQMDEAIEDFLDFKDEDEATTEATQTSVSPSSETKLQRKKRAPQLDALFSLFSGGDDDSDEDDEDDDKFKIDDIQVHTKQFPYPRYKRDDFKKGLYLAQSIQMAYFFALIIQIAITVRDLLWMRESGNSSLMRIMGLTKSSEYLSWILTAYIEILVIFAIGCIILYTGGILEWTNIIFFYMFLVLFAEVIIAFSYMVSSFFESASVGSVSAVILFLITFLPYIIIISLGSELSFSGKFLANLSFSTAFSYAVHYIMRLELQEKTVSFATALEGSLQTNDLKFGIFMMLLDLILYVLIGYLYDKYSRGEMKLFKLKTDHLGDNIGAIMKDVSKSYPSKPLAVNRLSVAFGRNAITCLLGRNGAGKSTIIKMLTGQVKQSSGEILVAENYNKLTVSKQKETVGLCTQNNILIPKLTAKEHLQIYAAIKCRKNYDAEVDMMLQSLNFGKHTYYQAQHLSGGYMRRLNIALAFLGSPTLVILDEPCSGVDVKARKNVWDLIEKLRPNRTVVLATHYLEEAEYLSDKILIMSHGKLVAEFEPDSLHSEYSRVLKLNLELTSDQDKIKSIEELKTLSQSYDGEMKVVDKDHVVLVIPGQSTLKKEKFPELIDELIKLKENKVISSFSMANKCLEDIFDTVNTDEMAKKNTEKDNGVSVKISTEHNQMNGNNNTVEKSVTDVKQPETKQSLSENTFMESARLLLWKRFIHFKRNYRLLLCVLVLPVVFEVLAMGFMKIRPPGEYDKDLLFSPELYHQSTEFFSRENTQDFQSATYNHIRDSCSADCKQFNDSYQAHDWVLKTHNQYIEKRYGGIGFNGSNSVVFYNNKGYHSMPTYLNLLNSAYMKKELNDNDYKIETRNHPLKLGREELTISSILQQVADAGISIIILVAFSLVVAGSSVYVISERTNGEKMQQFLAGVSKRNYWLVALLWDFCIYLIAMILAVIVFKVFNIGIYNALDNLEGICLLIFFFGLAGISAVHVVEKLFNDTSFANMSIFCLNVIIAFATLTVILLIDILAESDTAEKWSKFLNRLFLVFPQHALADGLIQICRNHIMAQVFQRFYINTYKSPVTSDLLLPHYLSMIIFTIVFLMLNYYIENRSFKALKRRFDKENATEMNGIRLSNSMIGSNEDIKVLIVDNLYKCYVKDRYAVHNVSFDLNAGECFGLLGNNGAGKSTIFSILSGQIEQTAGSVNIMGNGKISYCPQTNPLDSLLTVEETIIFYAQLFKIQDIETLMTKTLGFYQLEEYKKVLVKNLSGGNRRKLSVAVTCFNNTKLVLLDEPTNDMDPVTRTFIYKFIEQLIAVGRSVVLTSHTISEIDKLCNRIGVLCDGKLIAIGNTSQLKESWGTFYDVNVYFDHIESLSIERILKSQLPQITNISKNAKSMNFRVKVNTTRSDEENENKVNVDAIELKELVKIMEDAVITSNISYTLHECQFSQVYEGIMDLNGKDNNSNGGYVNLSFVSNEKMV